MNEKPILSVIMTSLAEDEYRLNLLKETLKSLKGSIKVPHEFIVIDNGNSEQTKILEDSFADVVIKNERNKGIGFGWNQGFEASSGKYISLIDNDLLFAEGWADDCIELLEKYPDEKLIATAFASFHHHSPKWFVGELDNHYLWNRSGTAGTVFKKEVMDVTGKWKVHPVPGKHWVNELYARGYKFISLKVPKVVHRGLTRSYDPKKLMLDGKWKKEWGL